MVIKELTNPALAQEMSDVNHAAFGYKQPRDLTRYQVQQRIKSWRYEAYGLMEKHHVVGFLYVDHLPRDFIEDPMEKCIESFSLLPWLHNRGLGKALLNHVVNETYPEASFNLCVNSNNKATFLYEKFGFVNYGYNFMIKSQNYIAMGLIRRSNRKIGIGQ